MRIANIRKQIIAAAGPLLAAAFLLGAPATPASPPDAKAVTPPAPRPLHVFVLSAGFRVEGIFIEAESKMAEVLRARPPAAMKLHLCRPQDRAAAVSLAKALAGALPAEPEITDAAVNAIECSYPDARERGARGS